MLLLPQPSLILLLELLKFHDCVLILFVILAFTKCKIVYNEFFMRRAVSYLLFMDFHFPLITWGKKMVSD